MMSAACAPFAAKPCVPNLHELLHQLLKYACSLKDFAAQRPLAALVPAEEMGRIRIELQAELDAAAAAAAAQPAADVKPAEGDTAMPDAAPAADPAAAAAAEVKPELAAAAAADAEMPPAEAAVPAPIADGLKAEAAPLDGAAPEAVKAENGPVTAAEPAVPAAVTEEDVKARWLASLTALHEVGCLALLLCSRQLSVLKHLLGILWMTSRWLCPLGVLCRVVSGPCTPPGAAHAERSFAGHQG